MTVLTPPSHSPASRTAVREDSKVPLDGLDPACCVHGEHLLVCPCGDPLTRVPAGSEWTYRSARTGASAETIPDPLLERYGWDGVAARCTATYSALRAREVLFMLPTRHVHFPRPCPPHAAALRVPEHHGWPGRLTPRGWVCRARGCAATLE